MYCLQLQGMTLSVDFLAGQIVSLTVGGKERLAARTPLFRLRLRNGDGKATHVSAYDAASCRETEDGAVYTDFRHIESQGLSVSVHLNEATCTVSGEKITVPALDAVMIRF